MSEVRVRPSQVSIVVVLLWIGFALTLVGAAATIITGTTIAASDPAAVAQLLKDLDLPLSWGSTAGPVLIVGGAFFVIVALIEAAFAIAIGRGSNIARILLTILIVLRLIGDLFFILTSWGAPGFMFGAFLDMGLCIILLLLLFNHQANEFFNDEVPAR